MRTVRYRPSTSPAFGDPVRDATSGASARASRQKQGGKRSESLFDRTHEVYHAHGRAVIVHLHPPVFGKPGAMAYAGSGHIDYMGVLRGGRAIAFDVKGVTGHSTALCVPDELPLTHKHHARSVRDRRRMLDQAALLLSIQRAGGLAAFLCVDKTRERCWIMHDVARIARGEDAPLRVRDRDLWPAVSFASTAELARGAAPIDYLTAWQAL
jgi:hypothetical protein